MLKALLRSSGVVLLILGALPGEWVFPLFRWFIVGLVRGE